MDEKLVEAMNTGRMVSAAEQVIYPLIQSMIQDRIKLATSEFRGGKLEHAAHIAYIAGLQDLENTLKNMQTKGQQASAALNK